MCDTTLLLALRFIENSMTTQFPFSEKILDFQRICRDMKVAKAETAVKVCLPHRRNIHMRSHGVGNTSWMLAGNTNTMLDTHGERLNWALKQRVLNDCNHCEIVPESRHIQDS